MPSTEILAQLDLTPDDVLDKKFYRGRGCAACNNTGFKGRTGLYELMLINDQLRELINKGPRPSSSATWPCRRACGRCGWREWKGLQRSHHASKKSSAKPFTIIGSEWQYSDGESNVSRLCHL